MTAKKFPALVSSDELEDYERTREHFGMCCPNCGRTSLSIRCEVWAYTIDDCLDDSNSDRNYDGDSSCYCTQCSWYGTVGEASQADTELDEHLKKLEAEARVKTAGVLADAAEATDVK